MLFVDLASGSYDLAALGAARGVHLRAVGAPPEALAAALSALREARGLKVLRLVSAVRALPAAITELRGLQQLEIFDHELPGLPSGIARLTRLRSLRLEMFHLASLPRSIARLTRLRELHVGSHHLCGLPTGLGALAELRALSLILAHEYVHDWERPAHFDPAFVQPLEQLFTILAGLPALASLTLGEPKDVTSSRPIFDRLPVEFAGLRALETLKIVEKYHSIAVPAGLVAPSLRRIDASPRLFAASEDELRLAFPNAIIARERGS